MPPRGQSFKIRLGNSKKIIRTQTSADTRGKKSPEKRIQKPECKPYYSMGSGPAFGGACCCIQISIVEICVYLRPKGISYVLILLISRNSRVGQMVKSKKESGHKNRKPADREK
jgi:hypothetical protein